jgi:hypothetical protein
VDGPILDKRLVVAATKRNPRVMYSICERDSVELLKEVPQPSVMTPGQEIHLAADRLYLAYQVQDTTADYAEVASRELGAGMIGLPAALIAFVESCAHLFGPPAAEVLSRHPLAEQGLEPFGVYEVHGSSWVRDLQRLSPAHRVDRVAASRHHIFTFYDEVFECVAVGFRCVLRFGDFSEVLRSALGDSEDDIT